ncbi:MAG: hypothetical protein AYK19_07650 [Theionarchaea archaeon DG-70-1]|nr:MAG: hypothetical protein AYK19_07650 [Theionarchaea archaeon DG-70-1]
MKRKLKKLRIVILLILFLLPLCTEKPQKLPISTNPGIQWDPAIYEDIVVWQDNRNGNADIYGYSLSTKEEFQITTDSSDQRYPVIYEDIVVWQDNRNGNADKTLVINGDQQSMETL